MRSTRTEVASLARILPAIGYSPDHATTLSLNPPAAVHRDIATHVRAVTVGYLGSARGQQLSDGTESHVFNREQLRVEAGHLLPPERDDAATDSGVLPRRLLGCRQQGRRRHKDPSLDGDGLERRQRRIPAGACGSGAGG